MATGPDLRIGDAERDAAAAGLREHYAQGRLSLEEFNQRIDAVFAATTQSQLGRVTSDLPHASVPGVPLPVAARGEAWDDGAGHRYSRRRPRLRFLTAIAALMLTWLVVISLLLPEMRGFPVLGRLGILVVIFGAVRSLLRRIMGGRRGWQSHRGFARSCHHPRWDNPGGPWR